jgi:hypothetical protein
VRRDPGMTIGRFAPVQPATIVASADSRRIACWNHNTFVVLDGDSGAELCRFPVPGWGLTDYLRRRQAIGWCRRKRRGVRVGP